MEVIRRWTVRIAAVGLSVFHIYTGLFGALVSPEQKAVHVLLVLLLVFLLVPMRKSKPGNPWWNIPLITAVFVGSAYTFFNWRHFLPLMIVPPNIPEYVMSVAMILAVLEAGRRAVGWVFPSLTAMCLAYAFWGHIIPGNWGHAPMSHLYVLKTVFFSAEGIWGSLTGVAATFISLFVIFGAILLTSGGGKTFIDLALLMTGKYRGGPAKVAVIASSMFGMLSGSSLANTATTGTFTIPLMKRLGYDPKFAAAVEAVASTGGSIMPPIMGTAAFIMAEFLGIPYLQIIIAAFVPAILFYTSVFMGVHFQAVKLDLKPVPAEQRPHPKDILTYPRISGLAIPVGVLIFLLVRGYSLPMVGGGICTAAILAYIFSDLSWSNMKERLRRMLPCLEAGGKALMFLTPVLVCANIVLGLLVGTGLIMKFSYLLVSFGQENLWLSLGIVALLVMILGTGLPATASYVIGVAVGASLLIGWGILPLAAHLFVFYYARVAVITPPVCAAVFIASSIAKSEWLPTAFTAVKLAPLLYLMPFIFVGDNTFLLMGPIPLILLNVSTAIFGVIMLASGVIGQFIVRSKRYERLAMIAAGLFLLIPGWQLDLLGAILSAAVIARQILQRRKEAQLTG